MLATMQTMASTLTSAVTGGAPAATPAATPATEPVENIIHILSDLELWHIFSLIPDAADLLSCSHVSCEWREQADDPQFWGKMVAQLWTGKAYVPRAFIIEADADGLTALSRKASYFASIRDAERSELRADELCAFTWERLRNDADVDLDYLDRADPSDVKGDVCHFRPSPRRQDRGLMSSLPGESDFGIGHGGGGEDMKWMISKLRDRRTGELVTCVSNGPVEEWGGQVGGSGDASDDDDGHYYPPKPVWRTENWGWKCRNHFATYTMIGTSASFREELEKVVRSRLVRRDGRAMTHTMDHWPSSSDDDDNASDDSGYDGEAPQPQAQGPAAGGAAAAFAAAAAAGQLNPADGWAAMGGGAAADEGSGQ